MQTQRRALGTAVLGLALTLAGPAWADDDPVVHVRFPAGTLLPYLDQQTAGGSWELACRAPCDQPLAAGRRYRIRGRTGHPSESFLLPRTAHVNVDASVGTPAATVFGSVFAVTGGVALVGGLALAVWPGDSDSDARGGRVVVGIGSMIVGAISVGVGLLVWHFGDTHAAVTPLAPLPQAKSSIQWTGTGIVF